MVARLFQPVVFIVDANGVPLSGAKYYFYESGTSTPVNTYSDSALSIANTNPVIADSAGRLGDVFLAADSYRILIKDANDVTIDDIDPYDVSSGSSFGSGLGTDNSGNTVTASEVNSQAGTSYTLLTGDRGKLVTFSNASAIAVTLPQANSTTFKNGWFVDIQNRGAGVVTITPTISTIDGLTSIDLITNAGVRICSDGTNYFTQRGRDNYPGVINKTAAYTVTTSDRGKLITADATSAGYTIDLPTAASAGDGFEIAVMKSDSSANVVTLDGNGSETINGSTTMALSTQYDVVRLRCNGTAWLAVVNGKRATTAQVQAGTTTETFVTPASLSAGKIVQSTEQATTSGTTVDFTSIPNWVKRITIMIDGVSSNGTSGIQVQIGDSGGIENTGYVGGSTQALSAGNAATAHSTGFLISGGGAAAVVLSGICTLVKMSGDKWAFSTSVGRSDTAGAGVGGGVKTLSATLDRVRLATVNGTDTFDAGSVNIQYE